MSKGRFVCFKPHLDAKVRGIHISPTLPVEPDAEPFCAAARCKPVKAIIKIAVRPVGLLCIFPNMVCPCRLGSGSCCQSLLFSSLHIEHLRDAMGLSGLMGLQVSHPGCTVTKPPVHCGVKRTGNGTQFSQKIGTTFRYNHITFISF